MDLLELAKAQCSCTGVAQLCNSSSLLQADFPIGHLSICCDTSGSRQRPLAAESVHHHSFFGSSRHQGNQTPSSCSLCVEGDGHRPMVQAVYSLPESQDHYPAHCSSATYPCTISQIHPCPCGSSVPSSGQLWRPLPRDDHH